MVLIYLINNFAPPVTQYTWQYSYGGKSVGDGNTTEKLTTGRLESTSELNDKIKSISSLFVQDYKNLNNGLPVLRWK